MQGQLIQFPGVPVTQTQAQPQPSGSLLPTFPVVATLADGYAKRFPWYAWLFLGAYAMFWLLRRRG